MEPTTKIPSPTFFSFIFKEIVGASGFWMELTASLLDVRSQDSKGLALAVAAVS